LKQENYRLAKQEQRYQQTNDQYARIAAYHRSLYAVANQLIDSSDKVILAALASIFQPGTQGAITVDGSTRRVRMEPDEREGVLFGQRLRLFVSWIAAVTGLSDQAIREGLDWLAGSGLIAVEKKLLPSTEKFPYDTYEWHISLMENVAELAASLEERNHGGRRVQCPHCQELVTPIGHRTTPIDRVMIGKVIEACPECGGEIADYALIAHMALDGRVTLERRETQQRTVQLPEPEPDNEPPAPEPAKRYLYYGEPIREEGLALLLRMKRIPRPPPSTCLFCSVTLFDWSGSAWVCTGCERGAA